MKIQTFKNKKGLIYGTDAMRIGCDSSGKLKIGTAEIDVSHQGESVLPLLFNGSSGEYKATFTNSHGESYDLGRVKVRGGRIVPPPASEVEMMELRCRLELVEAECEELRRRIVELSNIFDTNSLNFLIN